jgi:hypothetical protein
MADLLKVVITPPADDGGAAITSYTVEIIDTSDDSVFATVTGISTVNYDISEDAVGSFGGKTFKLRVKAVNSVGEGQYSVLSSAVSTA